jgi:uncharacterized membrane protein
VERTSPSEPTPPEWEWLIAHHAPARYDRTLAAHWGGRTVHFCARCSGELFGIAALAGAVLLFPLLRVPLGAPVVDELLACLPAAAATDWLLQTVRGHRSTNPIRVATGFLLGVAFAGWALLALRGEWVGFAIGGAIFAAYVGAVAEVLRRTGSMARVLAEHFP